jgi:hypothetical protein
MLEPPGGAGLMNDDDKPLAELIALRRQILESGDNWANFDEREVDRSTRSLSAVENKIVNSPCVSEDDKLKVLSVLLDSNDDPCFADDFKNSIFLRLREQSC